MAAVGGRSHGVLMVVGVVHLHGGVVHMVHVVHGCQATANQREGEERSQSESSLR